MRSLGILSDHLPLVTLLLSNVGLIHGFIKSLADDLENGVSPQLNIRRAYLPQGCPEISMRKKGPRSANNNNGGGLTIISVPIYDSQPLDDHQQQHGPGDDPDFLFHPGEYMDHHDETRGSGFDHTNSYYSSDDERSGEGSRSRPHHHLSLRRHPSSFKLRVGESSPLKVGFTKSGGESPILKGPPLGLLEILKPGGGGGKHHQPRDMKGIGGYGYRITEFGHYGEPRKIIGEEYRMKELGDGKFGGVGQGYGITTFYGHHHGK